MGRKSLTKNAALNIIKEIVNILFPMITFHYVTTLLGDYNYGKYVFGANIVSYISYIAAAGILRYAVRECAGIRDDRDKVGQLVNEIYTINVFTTIIAFVILAGLLIFWPKLHDYAPVILILSLTVLFATIGVDWVNSAFEDFAFITLRHIICQSLALILVFVLVRDSDDIVGYAAASSFGVVVPNIINRFHIKRKYGFSPKFRPSDKVKKHIKAIAFLFVCTIGTFIYINSDITILGIFYDDNITGYYGVSSRFYLLVKQVINAAFVVFIPRIANELSKDVHKSVEKLQRVLRLTIIAVLPASIGLIMIRKNLILLFSGEEYIRAQSSLLILGVALVPALLANFYINIVMIPLKKEKQVMIATLISAGVNLVLNLILIPFYAEDAAAVTTLIAELVMLGLGIFWTREMHFGKLLKPVAAGVTGGIGILGVCLVINRNVTSPLLGVVLPIVTGGILYLAVVALFYGKELTGLLKKKKSA